MAKYEKQVKELLEYIGGRQNIGAVSHCITRMRFVLVDPGRADVKAIEGIDCVKGTFTQAGQFQVIIGNEVPVFYNEFTAYAGIEGVSKDEVKKAAKSNQNLLQRIMGALGEIFAPLIPALVCGGLILGLRNVIGEINFFENGTQSLADISQFWAGMYSFLWLIGEAVFHLLPVGIVWSITKKMGTTQILGIVLGLTLVSSQLLNGFDVASTAAEDIPVWDFGFFQIQMIGYQGQVIAAMLSGFVLVYLEKFFRKICPAVISMIVVPFCSLLLAVIVAHSIVGPIGWKIGDVIADVVYGGLTSNFRVLFAAVFGLLYAPLVMTGLHHMTNAIDTQMISLYDSTILWPMIALSNIAQGSAVLAMAVLQRKNERAQQVNVPACISCYLGVTEPALFGVNLKYVFPLVCGMIGSSVAAMISIGMGVRAISIGVGGLPGILSIFHEYWGAFLLAMAAAIVIPFLLTLVVGAKRLSPAQRVGEEEGAEGALQAESAPAQVDGAPAAAESASAQGESALAQGTGRKVLLSPMDGKVIPVTEIPDQVFSQKILGDGVGIDPTGDTVYAPADGTVSVVAEDTGHSCGLTLEGGMEVLIHVGIDTVDMQGDGFELLVKVGDTVRRGDALLRFSSDKIKAAGHSAISAFVVADPAQASSMVFHTGMQAEACKTPVADFE